LPSKFFFIALSLGLTTIAGVQILGVDALTSEPSPELSTTQISKASAIESQALVVGAPQIQEAAANPHVDLKTRIEVRDELTTRSQSPRWNFDHTPIPPQTMTSYLASPQVSQVVYFDDKKITVIEPSGRSKSVTLTGAPAGSQGTIVYAATNSAIQSVQAERRRDAEASSYSSTQAQTGYSGGHALKENAFEIERFEPGLRDDRVRRVVSPADARARLESVDFSFKNTTALDREKRKEELRVLRSRVLTLGHGGVIVIKIAGGGRIIDGGGEDFAIFENALYAKPLSFLEFAEVGVSMSSDVGSAKWFVCNPPGELAGCVGAVPSRLGGDLFDLAKIGVSEARYIFIKDRGNNANRQPQPEPGEEEFERMLADLYPTEGVDLDAVRLFHAFSN
jgi:hypothetical protein